MWTIREQSVIDESKNENICENCGGCWNVGKQNSVKGKNYFKNFLLVMANVNLWWLQ